MSGKAKRKRNGATEMGSDASLEQIREILFGAHTRSTDEQLGKLHKRLNESIRSAQDQLAGQIKEVDAKLKQEISTLKDSWKAERTERTAALKAVAGDLRNASEDLHHAIAELEERLEQTDAELRKTLVNELKSTADKWSAQHAELSALVDEEFDDVRSNTPDRGELSDLFRELGQRINGELKKPAPKG